MSLRPRSARSGVRGGVYNQEVADRVQEAISQLGAKNVAATAERNTAMQMAPVVFGERTASTGAFVSVPDTREHEDLARRVSELEALFGNFNTGYKAFEGTYRAQTAQLTEYNTCLAVVEQKCERMAGEIKLLSDKASSLDNASLRTETLLSNMQSSIDRLRSDIRRIEQVCRDKIDDYERHEAKGFQQNDQPTRFMGSGRM